MSKFIPILTLDSKRWTLAQARRVWRINAAAIAYFAEHPGTLDYNTEAGQDYFFAICQYFMTHPLIDESTSDPPDDAEKQRREQELDAYVTRLLP